jgi:aspartyl-tRNA(Asn)/glutamyl-tRNA(Gln) amidotransferase subunit C
MLKREDIEYLATLSRVDVSDSEKDELASQLDSVLAYVSEISKIVTDKDAKPVVGENRNRMRPDSPANPGGEYTEAILLNAPKTEDGYFKTKRIL